MGPKPANQKVEIKKHKMIFCEPCNYKQLILTSEFPEDLQEIKTAPLQGSLPTLDPVTKKTIIKPEIKQIKKYKCPKCGRGVRLRDLLPAYTKIVKEREQMELKAKEEEAKRKRIEDGIPPAKKADPDFTGEK